MTANYSVLPISAEVGQRGRFLTVVSFAFHAMKRFARAYRHRREVMALAAVDRYLLSDIGITRSDLHDAFSEPLWEDPTALLRERALERRLNRTLMRGELTDPTDVEPGFRRPPTDRPARQAV
jgi:uncharacterized protein YjiS (DUF1127 family)